MNDRDLQTIKERKICPCGKSFIARAWEFAGAVIIPPSNHCDECIDEVVEDAEKRKRAEHIQRRKRQVSDQWAKICPPLYREWKPDLSPLSAESRDVLKREWARLIVAKHVYFTGDSGCNKTFAAYRLLKAKLTAGGGAMRIAYIDAAALREIVTPTDDRKRRRESERQLDDAMAADVVIFDDFGQSVTTSEAIQERVLSLLEERLRNNRSMIITSQFDPSSIAKRFGGSEAGAAIARRLQDYFTTIKLSR